MIDNTVPPSAPPGWFTDPWNDRQLRYFDGAQWTSHTAPSGPPSPPAAQFAPPLEESGYPFGEQTLVLRPIADKLDVNIMCAIENIHGQQIANIQPLAAIAWTTRSVADLPFAMIRPDGTPMLYLTRYGGWSRHIVQVTDPAGADLGRLRQTATSYGTRMPMMLEFGGQPLGLTELLTSRRKRAAVHEPIHNSHGAVVAYVDRRWHPRTGSRNPQFDYTLDCSVPTAHPLSTLTLATAFAHYMYDRLQMGGPLGGHRNPSPLN